MGYRHKSKERYYGSISPSRNEKDNFNESPSFERNNKRPGGPMNIIGTKILYFDTKKFYLDIIEESSGKMLKLAEILQSGQRSSLIMDLETAEDFQNRIRDFCNFISSNVAEENNYIERELKTDIMVKDMGKYYLDLLVNHRGIFLRVKLKCATAFDRQLIFPADGLRRVRNAIRDLLFEHGSDKKRKVSIVPIDQPIVINHECNRSDEVTTSEDVKVKKERQNDDGGERVRERPDDKKSDRKDRSFQFEVKITNEDSFLSINSKFKSVTKVPKKSWQEFLYYIGEKLNELIAAHDENDSSDLK